MKLQTRFEQNCCVIELNGYLDASSSIVLDQALREAIALSPQRLLVNLQWLDYISSAGLGVIISYVTELEEKGILLILFAAQPKIKNVFGLLGLDDIIPTVATKEEAFMYRQNASKGM